MSLLVVLSIRLGERVNLKLKFLAIISTARMLPLLENPNRKSFVRSLILYRWLLRNRTSLT